MSDNKKLIEIILQAQYKSLCHTLEISKTMIEYFEKESINDNTSKKNYWIGQNDTINDAIRTFCSWWDIADYNYTSSE